MNYDLHIHSCLSPCGDDASVPSDIVGMGVLNNLSLLALTDHNTARNCPAFLKCAGEAKINALCGMELTTSEDIHVVCLFEKLDDALDFDEFVYKNLIKVKNKPKIFGNQLVVDENDNIIATEEFLLSNATKISIDAVSGIVKGFHGTCYPAHIDRMSNGIIAVLGDFPSDLGFEIVEFHDEKNIKPFYEKYKNLKGMRAVVSSDAHVLWDIKDASEK